MREIKISVENTSARAEQSEQVLADVPEHRRRRQLCQRKGSDLGSQQSGKQDRRSDQLKLCEPVHTGKL
jgi:predicted Zn-dependent protease